MINEEHQMKWRLKMMKLGTGTGSLMNHVYSTISSDIPKVGDGATILGWSDRHAGTVISVETLPNSGKYLVTVQRDNAKRIDKNGMSDSQSYEYWPNEYGMRYYFRSETKDGRLSYVQVRKSDKGRWNMVRGEHVIFGVRDEYYDYSF